MPPSGTSDVKPAGIAHFAIFNPSIRLPEVEDQNDKERDRDEEEDLAEVAQIIFYTSKEPGKVTRDQKLRQVGLARGLLSFVDMLVKSDAPFWAVHSQKARRLIYTPEPGFFMYIVCVQELSMANRKCIDLACNPDGKSSSLAQGLSDHMLVAALERGYDDFRLLHGPLSLHAPPSAASSLLLDNYFTRFSHLFEMNYLFKPQSLSNWLGGFPVSQEEKRIEQAVETFFDDYPVSWDLYIVGRDGPVTIWTTKYGEDQALLRYLLHLVQSSLPAPPSKKTLSSPSTGKQTLGLGALFGLGGDKKKSEVRKSSWASMGSWVPELRRTPSSILSSEASTSVSAANKGQTSPTTMSNYVSRPKTDTWGLNFGAIGESVESIGNVFKLGGFASVEQPSLASDMVKGELRRVVGEENSSLKLLEGKGAPSAVQEDTMPLVITEEDRLSNHEAAISEPMTMNMQLPSAPQNLKQVVSVNKSMDAAIGLSSKQKHPPQSLNMTTNIDSSIVSHDSDERKSSETATNLEMKLNNIPIRPPEVTVSDARTTASNMANSLAPKSTIAPVSSEHCIESFNVSIPELKEAAEPDEMDWDKHDIWIEIDGGKSLKHKLHWIIRDSLLVALLIPSDLATPFSPPSNNSTMNLISAITLAMKSKLPSTPEHLGVKPGKDIKEADIWIYKAASGSVVKSSEMTQSTEQRFVEIRDIFESTPMVNEIYSKAVNSSDVFVARRRNGNELYLLCGKKDASLTDASRSVRTLLKAYPNFDV
ncbi:hypothetical protein L204_102843 [Cryptococcus depauperatus]